MTIVLVAVSGKAVRRSEQGKRVPHGLTVHTIQNRAVGPRVVVDQQMRVTAKVAQRLDGVCNAMMPCKWNY
jgi:hypothetical protein